MPRARSSSSGENVDFRNRVALVTGAAQGLGKAICEALLDKGCKVTVTDLDFNLGEKTVQEFNQKYGTRRAIFVRCDVTKEDEFDCAIRKTKEVHGRFDILVNNAGLWGEHRWRDLINVNLEGVIIGTKLAFTHMGKNHGGQGGAVVNVASTLGLAPIPFAPVYSATKHAVVGLTRSYGDPFHYNHTGVSVSAVCPQTMKTSLYDDIMTGLEADKADDKVFKLCEVISVKTSFVAQGVIKVLEENRTGLVISVHKDKGYIEEKIPSYF